MDIKNLGKGALIKPVSLKDYRFEVVPSAIMLPSNFEIIFGGKIKHQDGSSSCVSQATSYYAEVLNFKETGVWTELSPKFLYAQCFQPQGGSYVKDNMALMCGDGIAAEIDLSSYDNGNPPSEQFMERKTDITPQCYSSAMVYLAKSYYTWDNISVDLYKKAIVQGNGCVVCSWGNNYCWANGQILLPDTKSQMEWMHGIYLCGFNDETKQFKFINSWGTEWGNGGYGYLPYDYITQGYVSNPVTLIDQSNNYYGLLQKLISLYKNLISLLLQK